MRRRAGDERGMTLVEVMVTSAVLLALAIPMLRFFESAVSGAAELETSTQLHSDGRAALDQLTRELRQAYTGTTALPQVAVIDPQSLRLYSPTTDDSPTTETAFRLRRVDYRFAGGELQRSVTWSTNAGAPPWTFPPAAGPWAPVMAADSVSFTGQAVNGTIRSVDIRITSPNSRGRADRTFETSITLRNPK